MDCGDCAFMNNRLFLVCFIFTVRFVLFLFLFCLFFTLEISDRTIRQQNWLCILLCVKLVQ